MIYYIQLDYDNYHISPTYQMTEIYDSSTDKIIHDKQQYRHYNQMVESILQRWDKSKLNYELLSINTVALTDEIIRTTIWIKEIH